MKGILPSLLASGAVCLFVRVPWRGNSKEKNPLPRLTAISCKRGIVAMNSSGVEDDDDAQRENARISSELSPSYEKKRLLPRILSVLAVASLILNAALAGLIVFLSRRAPSIQGNSLPQTAPQLPPTICYPDLGVLATESQHSLSSGRWKCHHSDRDLHRVVSMVLYQDMEEDDNSAEWEKTSELSTVEDWKLVPADGRYLTLSIRVLSPRCHGSGNILNSINLKSNPTDPIICSKFTVQDSEENGRLGEGEVTIVDAHRRLSIVLGIVNLAQGASLKSAVSGEGCKSSGDQTSFFTFMKV